MLNLSGISKSFIGVQALSGINLDVRAGEIHALVGENGAGKSTTIKIVAGVYKPDAGQMEFEGKPVQWARPADAKNAGIHVIYQEFVLFPHLSVAENIYLGHERRNRFGFVDHARTRQDASDLLRRLGVDIDPQILVSELTVADQQMVEISKALVHKVKLLILDEPTAVISGREADLLFARLAALKAEGVAILYVSHRLEEIFQIADRVTVFKDGAHVATKDIGDVTRDRLISMMVGRDLKDIFPPKKPKGEPGKVVLKAENVSVEGRVRNAGIEVRAGEITALAGLVGAGRTELAMGIFGGLPMSSGSVWIDGEKVDAITPATAISKGVGFVTEDRKGQGLAMFLDVAANISAANLSAVTRNGLIDRRLENEIARKEIDNYRVVCRGPATGVATMSGGNQQKVIVARWARTSRKVLILDEPTRGVDVGAKTEIYRIMRGLAGEGIAILMISSELPEVVGMSDRVVVMREGAISGELTGANISEEAIMSLATQHPTGKAPTAEILAQ
ncbi:sugar ABC transporter ATP-binding protein [Mesorhizobium helmanticense]|uniref:Sugar ABC transporter ATP-binding protein n=1 Tax=Mesorhizobium helmanticense TaxID=1776423 RepID=A0A2T4IMH2_9HYPH|nr:sugar ABC transporter ATP-binding protein [Mesorhizobium helmanticense]PTE06847.1 sugar ABC transporter ATP-binding protein [Mesorhizobium helmanticense]